MSDWIIKAENLGKKYRLQHQAQGQRYVALRDVIAQKCAAPFRALFGRSDQSSPPRPGRGQGEVSIPPAVLRPPSSAPPSSEDFWALKDVSFEVKQGEVLGIIGRNGAGKSTLLKILSRITEPTEGRVTLRGRVASLLEVGTGFHPELTGRENIFLNGAILGMTRAEIRKKFDEIVAFAEVEKFLDTPVKRYSSGMYVRLAFAVAAHLEPEILIVDEVLAVGDAEFQKKCLGKMDDVAHRDGRTVLFVSHNMAAISRLCTSVILFQAGSVESQGNALAMTERYLSSGLEEASDFVPVGPHTEELVSLVKAELRTAEGKCADCISLLEEIHVRITYRVHKRAPDLRIGFRLHSSDGTVVLTSGSTDRVDETVRSVTEDPSEYTSVCRIPSKFLNHGRYSITIASDVPNRQVNFLYEHALSFSVEPSLGANDHLADGRHGSICLLLPWKTERSN